MLWIDKYQPKGFDQLLCHKQITALLKSLVQSDTLPHIIFYGKSGAGKKTRILSLLKEIFGEKILKVKVDTIQPEGVNTEFVCCSSLYHNQVSASQLGGKDRICVQYLIKQLASQTPAAYFSMDKCPPYRVFVIQDAEFLSIEAQAGLRRTLEKYASSARVILHCQQLSSIIQPLRSRCLCIRIPQPTEEEILNVLTMISEKEMITLSQPDYNTIIKSSNRNLRRAILSLEAYAMNQQIQSFMLPWEVQCQTAASLVSKDPGIAKLQQCREYFYDMLTSLIPGQLILETILRFLIENALTNREPLSLIHKYSNAAAHYSYTMALGSKEIWHLEAFIAYCMSFYQTHHQK